MVLILYYYIPRITKFDWSIKNTMINSIKRKEELVKHCLLLNLNY